MLNLLDGNEFRKVLLELYIVTLCRKGIKAPLYHSIIRVLIYIAIRLTIRIDSEVITK